MRMVYVRTSMPHPLVVSLLDGLYPSRRPAWKAPDGWRLDRAEGAGVDIRLQHWYSHDLTDVTLRVWGGCGPQTVQLLTHLLEHDGAGFCDCRPARDFTGGWRDDGVPFTAADFAGALHASGGKDPLDVLAGGPAEPADGLGLGWGVVANVARGTRLFAPRANVWVSERFNGADDRRWVVGRHRGSGRFIRTVVDETLLQHRRPKELYSPAVLRLMESVSVAFLSPTAEAAGSGLVPRP
ncbi:hypothetical protein AB0H83_51045 [Dactylosporangium sp. NPDC050688]|uniref:hypothetical protein n=1 Tax=Dactylosporangium sp. NPDC050688 TaxID=3157217 RepID=UPI0033EAD507